MTTIARWRAAFRCPRCTIAFFVLLNVFLSSWPLHAGDTLQGINRPNLAWMKPNERAAVINSMAEAGFTLVRFTAITPIASSLDAVEEATRNGMRVLLQLGVGDPVYFRAPDAMRTSYGRTWNAARLSMIDLDLFRSFVREVLTDLDRRGVRLAGLQIGNEINWAHFNGDLRISSRAGVAVARSVETLHDPDAFLRGLDRYIDALKIVREELARSTLNHEVQLIASGLVVGDFAFADAMGFEVVPARTALMLLRQRGLDQLVDIYGVHVYPPATTNPLTMLRSVEVALSQCADPQHGKPCWLTEWGFTNTEQACPTDDRRRAAAVRRVMGALRTYRDEGRLGAAFYFDWDRSPHYSVWRCNGLTDAGRAILDR